MSIIKDNLLSYNKFRAGSAWIILIIGLACYIVGFTVFSSESVWHEIFLKVGDVLIIGVLIGYLSNAAQFLGIFKQDLQDIVYGKEFIKQKKDVYPLWETISKEMFKNKFPSIHKEFLKAIDGYFPKNDVLYYNDYEMSIAIEWEDKQNDIIKVTDVTSLELISDTKDKVSYNLKTWTKVDNIDDYKTVIDFFEVNSDKKTMDFIRSEETEHGLLEEYSIELSGATKYSIKHKKTKVYDLKTDNWIGFRAQYIVNNFRIRIDCPEDISWLFTCRGTQHDFEDVNSKKYSLEKKYKGILFPRQGFICTLIEK